MAYRKGEVVVVVMVMAVLACMTVADGAITCGTVSSKLAPCIGYLTGSAPAPTAGCCGGVKGLYSATKASRPDRVTACGCIKSLASSLGGKLNNGHVSSLPGQCGVSLGYSISISTNCNTIP